MSKIVGLTHALFVELGRLVAGAEVEPTARRHFEVKGWVRQNRLTDDGRAIWRRALQDPPRDPAFPAQEGRERRLG